MGVGAGRPPPDTEAAPEARPDWVRFSVEERAARRSAGDLRGSRVDRGLDRGHEVVREARAVARRRRRARLVDGRHGLRTGALQRVVDAGNLRRIAKGRHAGAASGTGLVAVRDALRDALVLRANELDQRLLDAVLALRLILAGVHPVPLTAVDEAREGRQLHPAE